MTDAARGLALPVLATVRITTPCPLAEDAWQPGQRTRHCAECDLDVHNFSALTAVEAAAMVNHSRQTGTRLCASFVQDARGTIITADSRAASGQPSRANAFMRVLAALGLISAPAALAACASHTGDASDESVRRMRGDIAEPPRTQDHQTDIPSLQELLARVKSESDASPPADDDRPARLGGSVEPQPLKPSPASDSPPQQDH